MKMAVAMFTTASIIAPMITSKFLESAATLSKDVLIKVGASRATHKIGTMAMVAKIEARTWHLSFVLALMQLWSKGIEWSLMRNWMINSTKRKA